MKNLTINKKLIYWIVVITIIILYAIRAYTGYSQAPICGGPLGSYSCKDFSDYLRSFNNIYDVIIIIILPMAIILAFLIADKMSKSNK